MLASLADAFDQWKEGKVSSDQIHDMIHEFHQGSSRELFSRYNPKMHESTIAHAIVAGIFDRNKVPPELLEHLANLISLNFHTTGSANAIGLRVARRIA